MVVIGILGTGLYYSSTIQDRIKLTQANNFANKIISTAESVFYLGEPSKATITVYLPESVKDIEVIDNQIVISVQTSTGLNKISFKSNVPIIENPGSQISNSYGLKKIRVNANSTQIIISQG